MWRCNLITQSTKSDRFLAFFLAKPSSNAVTMSPDHHRRSSSFKETLNAFAQENLDGVRTVNQYIFSNTILGTGSFATVEMAVDRETGIHYAVSRLVLCNQAKVGADLMGTTRNRSRSSQSHSCGNGPWSDYARPEQWESERDKA